MNRKVRNRKQLPSQKQSPETLELKNTMTEEEFIKGFSKRLERAEE